MGTNDVPMPGMWTELLLVSVVMWFVAGHNVCESLHTYFEPSGFDISNTSYWIRVGTQPTVPSTFISTRQVSAEPI